MLEGLNLDGMAKANQPSLRAPVRAAKSEFCATSSKLPIVVPVASNAPWDHTNGSHT